MIKVYGSGEDMIVVEGDIEAEFYAEEPIHYLALSDGTYIKLEFVDGNWKITPDESINYQLEEASNDEDIASDVLTIEEDYTWVMFGKEISHVSQQ